MKKLSFKLSENKDTRESQINSRIALGVISGLISLATFVGIYDMKREKNFHEKTLCGVVTEEFGTFVNDPSKRINIINSFNHTDNYNNYSDGKIKDNSKIKKNTINLYDKNQTYGIKFMGEDSILYTALINPNNKWMNDEAQAQDNLEVFGVLDAAIEKGTKIKVHNLNKSGSPKSYFNGAVGEIYFRDLEVLSIKSK